VVIIINKSYMILGILALLVMVLTSGCVQTSPVGEQNRGVGDINGMNQAGNDTSSQVTSENHTFTQVVKIFDENETIIIEKNKLLKTADIEIYNFYDTTDLEDEDSLVLVNTTGLINFTTVLSCRLIALLYFNRTALEELTKEWEAQGFVVEDESAPEEQGESTLDNILEGYKVKRVRWVLKDKIDDRVLSECILTGPSMSDAVIKIYV